LLSKSFSAQPIFRLSNDGILKSQLEVFVYQLIFFWYWYRFGITASPRPARIDISQDTVTTTRRFARKLNWFYLLLELVLVTLASTSSDSTCEATVQREVLKWF
jgi:hypothetical protein